MKGKSMRGLASVTLFAAMMAAPAVSGQTIDGDVVGVVFDATGATVSNARIELDNVATGVKNTAKTGADGTYRFSNVPVGGYMVAVEAPSFAVSLVKGVQVELNKTTTVNATLQPATVRTDVNVVDAPALLDTTTAQITNTYTAREVEDLAISTNAGKAALNLSLLSGGVASSGGVGAGTGPAVGGQRPRSNTFTVEGVDDNRKDITGPTTLVPAEGVAEFSLLQNQYSAEFGHSAGGQFNTVLKNGTNDLHGSLFAYSIDRYLMADDQAFSRQGITSAPRYDNNRFGGDVGGPIRKNKLFYYGLFEANPVGYASTLSQGIDAPTAAGYQMLASMPSVSPTNLGILQKYLPAAPVENDGTTPVGSANIPLGATSIVSPSYYNYYNWLGSIDYTLSSSDQLRGRFIGNRVPKLDDAANIPAFWTTQLTTAELVSISEFHTFRPNLLNELRLAYSRFDNSDQTPNVQYPGLSQFPNIMIWDDLGVQIGPDPNAPQTYAQNSYQLIDNVSWVKGKHDVKFGIDLRDQLAFSNYIQYQRGDYEYLSMAPFLLDTTPDYRVQKSIGNQPYSGNAAAYYAFVNDNWRVTHNFSLNLGVRYEYNGVSQSMRDFSLESAASVPGVISFFAPQAQKLNFAPRFGFAYSPGNKATTTIRGGFGIGYDPIFDNVGTNIRPPQDAFLISSYPTGASNFIGNGGITTPPLPPNATPSQMRAVSTAWMGNQELGYVMNASLGVQHEFAHDFTLEVRDLATKGVHLLEQTELNRNAVVTPELYLPTYLQNPGVAALNALPVTLTQLNALKAKNNPLAAYGFANAITAYEPTGNSLYNGIATELRKRFSHNLQFLAAYTWSHLQDDSTAEINTTDLTPRRPQDFGNLRGDWSNSALDHPNRATVTWIYEAPWFAHAQNGFLRNALGGYQLTGSYIVESGELVTPQSGTDANMNGDSVGDRTIVNTAGVPGTGSGVSTLKNSSGATVAYLATNPNAEYINAGSGALANAGRNTLATPRINNWDVTVAKNFAIGERYKLQLRADFFNLFNHPQYTAGLLDDISAVNTSSSTTAQYLIPNNPLFGQWNQVFASNSRYIQLGLKFRF
jgi:hypothetical protein